MRWVANTGGLVNPVTDVANSDAAECLGTSEYVVADVACCSDEQDTHGDLPYGMGHRFAGCKAVTDPLWAGLWVAEGCGDCADNGCKNACCVRQKSYPEAVAVCAADNARLCTKVGPQPTQCEAIPPHQAQPPSKCVCLES